MIYGMADERSKVGRRSYGDRKLLPARVPTELAVIVEEAAREQGMPDTAKYLWKLIADAHGYPYTGPRPSNSQQGVLQISA